MATRHLALVAGITRHSDLGPAVAASLHRRGARVVALCADEQAERRLRAVVGAAAPGLGVVIAARAPATVGELYADPVAHALEGVGLAARRRSAESERPHLCGDRGTGPRREPGRSSGGPLGITRAAQQAGTLRRHFRRAGDRT